MRISPTPSLPRSTPTRTVRGTPTPPVADDERRLEVGHALALAAGAGVVEVYVGWPELPIRVSGRHRDAECQGWETAGVVLRARVAEAIRPLLGAGWCMEGSPVAAMRWDTAFATTGQIYAGCWVRMRAA